MGKQGELDSAYCNTLLLAHWSVCQKLNHVSSAQFNSVKLRRSVRIFICETF